MSEAIRVGDKPLSKVRSTKSLGTQTDEHLCKRVSSGLKALKRDHQFVPRNTLLTIYNAFVKLLFDNCDAVWGNLNKTLTARLKMLQNRAARIITRKSYCERSADIRKDLGWDDVETNRKKHLAILMY